LPERYDVPEAAATAIAAAKALGGRVVAVGTTVTRALEGAAANAGGRLVAGEGTTDLLLGPRTRRAVVDGILTGAHDAGTSHFALLESFAPRAVLELGHAFAEAHGYLGHEFGDAILVLPSLPERSAQLGIDRG
jgi:S-adenosylmethionine:tRNA ribosyltransferase-isomerase